MGASSPGNSACQWRSKSCGSHMPGAPSGLRGPAPPRAAGWCRARLSPRWRSGLPFTSAPEENKKKIIKFFPFRPRAFFLLLLLLLGFASLTSAATGGGGGGGGGRPGPAPGGTRGARDLQSPRLALRPAGSGVWRAAAGAEPRGRALGCAGGREAARGPGGAGLRCCPLRRRRRYSKLAALGPARTFLACRAAPLPPPPAQFAPAPCSRARGHAAGEVGAAGRERAGSPWAAANLRSPGPPQPRLSRVRAAPGAEKEKVGGKAMWRGGEGRCCSADRRSCPQLGFIERLELTCPESRSCLIQSWG